MDDPTAAVGVIGGSGFYALLSEGREVHVPTPYGEPSDCVTLGDVGGRPVAFLPRHGRGHRYPAHRINYRANLWALHHLGVRQVVAPCAVGSLDPAIGLGDLVVPDQLLDRTSRRESTFYDAGAVHVPFADPYCERGRMVVRAAAETTGWRVSESGTLVVIDGPRFSTRAESAFYAAAGATIVNMTGQPEAVLARELGLCYTCVALVTDVDAGIRPGDGVRQDEVFAAFRSNLDRLRALVLEVVTDLDDERDCACPHALDGTDAGQQRPDPS